MEEVECQLKTQLINLARDNAEICADLLNIQASPQIIAENIFGCSVEEIEDFIASKRLNNERLSLAIEQLEKLDIDAAYNCNLHFFSREKGLVTTTPRLILRIDSFYEGEDVVADLEQVIPELLLPLLYDAVKSSDFALSQRINEAIAHVLKLLANSKKENSNE
jgi:hypothetical protein|nr:MAG TPA: hypothetical protein [Caudoviricetes sp.]